jgi:hypothetical protein
MDVHQNARLTFNRRVLLVERVSGSASSAQTRRSGATVGRTIPTEIPCSTLLCERRDNRAEREARQCSREEQYV